MSFRMRRKVTLTTIISSALFCGVWMPAHHNAHAQGTYTSMTQLEQNEERETDYQEYTDNQDSNTVVMAPHGGGIEPGTSEITRAVADKNDCGYYNFKGVRPTGNHGLHVSSTNYNDETAQDMVNQSNRTVTFHNTANTGSDVYIGGRDQSLQSNIKDALTSKGFSVVTATGGIAGKSTDNIVNQNKQGAGVQLEMSKQLVKRFFKNGDVSRVSRENNDNYTSTMDSFRDGITAGLNES